MPRHCHRVSGWPDLISGPHRALLLLVGLLAAPTAAQIEEPTLLEPRVPSPEDSVFMAPFVNVTFLRSIREELAQLQIIRERSGSIYLDRKTLLVWTARDNGRDIDWRRANDYCVQLELAGFDDWRLPILGELEEIMDPLSSSGYSTPREISLSSCCVWSATRRDDVAAWNFNFRYSKRFSGSLTHTYDLRALCVRRWSEADGWVPEENPLARIPPQKR